MLIVSHLTKKYSSTIANEDLNFTLDNGEIGVLLGPNGAGKSTAIKCIMGLLRFSGTIEIDGNPIYEMDAFDVKVGGVSQYSGIRNALLLD